jgi:hypothetical protein
MKKSLFLFLTILMNIAVAFEVPERFVLLEERIEYSRSGGKNGDKRFSEKISFYIDTVNKEAAIAKFDPVYNSLAFKNWKLEEKNFKIYPIPTPQELNKFISYLDDEYYRVRPLQERYLSYSDVIYPDCSMQLFAIPDSLNGNSLRLVDDVEKVANALVEKYDAKSSVLLYFNGDSLTSADDPGAIELRAISDNAGDLSKFSLKFPGKNEKQYDFIKLNGQIIVKDENGKVLLRLVANELDKKNGGAFSLFLSGRGNSEKQTDFYLSKNSDSKKWVVEAKDIQNIDGRIILRKEGNPEVGTGTKVTRSIVGAIPGLLDGVFVSLIWNTFYSEKDQKETIRDKILEQARSNDVVKKTFTDDELKALVQKIIDKGYPKIAPMSRQDIIVGNAFEVFSEAMMAKFLQKMMPLSTAQDVINTKVNQITEDFKNCREKSGKSDDLMICLEKFSRSAPFRLGSVIIEAQLRDNLKEQKLNGANLVLILDEAKIEYNNCMQSRYFPSYDRYQENVKKDPKTKEKFSTEEVVQSCVLAGITNGASKAMEVILPLSLADYIPDAIERQKNINELLEIKDQCLKDKKLVQITPYYKTYEYEKLGKLTVDEFKGKLGYCTDQLTMQGGERAIDKRLKTTVEFAKNFKTKIYLEQKSAEVITNSYWPCVNAQAKKDPKLCESAIMSEATHQVALQSFLTKAEDVFSNPEDASALVNRIDKEFLKDCFSKAVIEEDRAKCLTSGIIELSQSLAPAIFVGNIDKVQAIKEVGATLPQEIKDRVSLKMKGCFKEHLENKIKITDIIDNLDAVIATCSLSLYQDEKIVPEFIASHVAVKLYDKEMATNDSISKSGVILDPAWRVLVETDIKNCFSREFNKLATLKEAQDKTDYIQKKCTTKLYKDLIPKIVDKILEQKLLESLELTSEQSKPLRDKLVGMFIRNIYDVYDPKILIAKSKEFSPQATVFLMKDQLHKNITDQIDDPEVAEKIYKLAEAKLFTRKLGLDLQSAYAGRETDEDIALIISRFKVEGALFVAPLILENKTASLIKDEKLRTVINKDLIENNFSGCLKVAQTPLTDRLNNRENIRTELRLKRIKNRDAGVIVDEEATRKEERELLKAEPELLQAFDRNFKSCMDKFADEATKQIIAALVKTSTERAYTHLDPLWNEAESQQKAALLRLSSSLELKSLGLVFAQVLLSDDRPKDKSKPELDINAELDKYIKLIGVAINYNEGLANKYLKEIREEVEKIKAKADKNKEKLTMDDLMAVIMKSPILELVVNSQIGDFVKKGAMLSLSKQGVDKDIVERLGSPAMIDHVFSTTEGKKAMQLLKDEYLFPMIKGTGPSEISPRVEFAVKMALVKDTENDGFVETMFGAIVQAKIDTEVSTNVGTYGSILAGKYAWLRMGLRENDLIWHGLRSTPSGKAAVSYFADQVLAPSLTGLANSSSLNQELESSGNKTLTDEKLRLYNYLAQLEKLKKHPTKENSKAIKELEAKTKSIYAVTPAEIERRSARIETFIQKAQDEN